MVAEGAGPDLEISNAWLVDPASGREGPGEIVVSDGVLEAVTWLEGAEAEGATPDGVVIAPGLVAWRRSIPKRTAPVTTEVMTTDAA